MKYAMDRLIAFGRVLMWCCFGCFGVGLVDFFWQLSPSLGKGIITTCGIYGSVPVLSSFSQRPLCKSSIRETWQFAGRWAGSAGDLDRSGEESAEH